MTSIPLLRLFADGSASRPLPCGLLKLAACPVSSLSLLLRGLPSQTMHPKPIEHGERFVFPVFPWRPCQHNSILLEDHPTSATTCLKLIPHHKHEGASSTFMHSFVFGFFCYGEVRLEPAVDTKGVVATQHQACWVSRQHQCEGTQAQS